MMPSGVSSVSFSAVELYKLAKMDPDKPLLVKMTFGEIYPTYGFTYKDEKHWYRTFGITESGMDGSVSLIEIKAAMG